MDSKPRSFVVEINALKVLLCACVFSGVSLTAHAGLDEANAAYTSKNYAVAFKEFSALAKQGNPVAQNQLGLMYANGEGVTPNVKEALKLYRLSAAQGFALAQNNLGWMFYTGRGVEQDFALQSVGTAWPWLKAMPMHKTTWG